MSEVISKVSPAVTEAFEESAPYQSAFPPLTASHIDQWLYTSVAATFVQVTVADEDFEPLDDALNATGWRVFSVATLAVQFSPGFPVCN